MLSAMDAELFDSDLLESCKRDDARELQTVYLPSLAEIAVLKRQIRAEKEAKEALEGGPLYLKMYRQARAFRTDYSQGRITREH
jgi:hypothetical protein